MNEVKAKLRYLRIAPRKVRLVANLLKKLSIDEARAQLMFSKKRAAKPLLRLLESAISNAKNKKFNLDKLFVKEIRVDIGPRLKRYWPRARGAVAKIEKKMSHVEIILAEAEKVFEKKYKIKEKEKKEKIKEKEKKERKVNKEKEEKNINVLKNEKDEVKEKEKIFKKFFRRKSV